MWVTDGSPCLKINGNGVTCTSGETGDKNYNAMWVEGEGQTTGEHYWTVEFTQFEGPYRAVGLTNREHFKKGYDLRGLLYGKETLQNGVIALVQKFGPPIQSKDTIGILASFTEQLTRIRVYFYPNGKAQGLAFDVPIETLLNSFPVVRFSIGKGSALIRKQVKVPTDRVRSGLKKWVDIEGSWQVVPNSIQILGQIISANHDFDPNIIKLDIHGTRTGTGRASTSGRGRESSIGGIFEITLDVINHIYFKVKRTPGSWEVTSRARSTVKNVPSDYTEVEKIVSDLCFNPDGVIITGETLVIDQREGDSKISFTRISEGPKPFVGIPFRRLNSVESL